MLLLRLKTTLFPMVLVFAVKKKHSKKFPWQVFLLINPL